MPTALQVSMAKDATDLSSHLQPYCVGGQNFATRSSDDLAGCDRGGYEASTCVAARAWVAIIEIQCVSRNTVGEGRLGSACSDCPTPNCGPSLAPIFYHPAGHDLRRLLQRTGERNAERIDQRISGSGKNRAWNVIGSGFDDEPRQCAGDHPLFKSRKCRCRGSLTCVPWFAVTRSGCRRQAPSRCRSRPCCRAGRKRPG